MRPVKNTRFRPFDVGDEWEGSIITRLLPCQEKEYCRSRYRNFDTACGGEKRVLSNRTERCVFYLASDGNFLSRERDGRPLE